MPRINVLPHPLTTVSTTQVVPLGSVFYDYEGRGYVYVYNFGADSFAVGDVVCIATTDTPGYVSNTAATVGDVTDGTTIRPVIAGVALSIVATTQYGWLFFYGRSVTKHALTTDGNVAANDLLTVTDGAKIATREVTAATAHRSPIGVAWAADSSTTLLDYMLNGDGIYGW
jgi:hypothetical protein